MAIVIREIFENIFTSENANSRFFRNPGKSCTEVKDIVQYWKIENHEIAMRDIENAKERISEAKSQRNERLERLLRDPQISELIRLKRQPLYGNIDAELSKKYCLLESEDLLPDYEIRKDDFVINAMGARCLKEDLIVASDAGLFNVANIGSGKDEQRNEKNFHKVIKSKSDSSTGRSTESRGFTCEKRRRSIMRTETQKTILVAQPDYLEFRNFEPRKMYTRAVVIRNVSNNVARFQLEVRSADSKFSYKLETPTGDRENLASGMNLKIIVQFCGETSDDSEESIVLRVQYGKNVIVRLSAHRDPPVLSGMSYHLSSCNTRTNYEHERLSLMDICDEKSSQDSWNLNSESSSIFSSDILDEKESIKIYGYSSFAQFEHRKCFVGEEITVARRLKNIGENGRFFIMSEIDWNSMSIEDISEQNSINLQCFAVSPAYFVLKRNEEIDLLTYFFPNAHGLQVDKLYIVCDNLAVHPIELIGDGVMYDPRFIVFETNIEEGGSDSAEWPLDFCGYNDYRIDFGIEISSRFPKRTITVTNTSGLAIDYRWETGSSDPIDGANGFQLWSHLPADFVSIRPSNGIFRPCWSVTFEISVQMTNLSDGQYRTVLQLYLVDIPLAAIPMEYENSTIESRVRQRLCKNSVDVRAKEIDLLARCSESPDSKLSSTSYEIIDDNNEQIISIDESFGL